MGLEYLTNFSENRFDEFRRADLYYWMHTWNHLREKSPAVEFLVEIIKKEDPQYLGGFIDQMIIPSVSSELGRPIKLTLSTTPGGSDPKDYLPMYLLGGSCSYTKKGINWSISGSQRCFDALISVEDLLLYCLEKRTKFENFTALAAEHIVFTNEITPTNHFLLQKALNSYRATEFDDSITEISPSYFAGQIDGTANQNFVIANPTRRRRLPLFRVNISSKNSRVVQILHEVYGGSINKNNVVMEGNGAAQFAEDIGKYLIFKRDDLIESIDLYFLQIPANNKSEIPRKLKALQDKLLKTKT